MWFAMNLLFSIIRTIGTSPGNIPEDREWDMDLPDDEEGVEESSEEEVTKGDGGEKLTNPTFE